MGTAVAPSSAAMPVAASAAESGMSWWHLTRLGFVQAAIGAVVVLLTTTINRVIVVELGLPALIPGLLVALHFAVQLYLRPRLGHDSDGHGRRTPWILGGMAVCAVGGVGVAASVPVMAEHPVLGVVLASLASMLLGAGVSASGTPLLALMSERARPSQRAGAAAITWILMIVGIIITAATSGSLLDPFSFTRLIAIAGGIGGVGLLVSWLATLGVEKGLRPVMPAGAAARGHASFRHTVRTVWQEPAARLFSGFIFLAMFAYSAQDLILEPFAGVAFGMTPGESTKLSGAHHGGVLAGMILAALLASRTGQLRHWAAAGCAASAVTYLALVASPGLFSVPVFTLVVVLLGIANGVFAIGAIGSMMALTGDKSDGRAGLRLGVFGAAQALAYAVGTMSGAAGVDLARAVFDSPVRGYLAVFGVQAFFFAASAWLALRSASSERANEVFQQRGEMLSAVIQ
ncbi:MAG: BCD family MFS transporter [Gemmatimonas sp.]|jgi:BCD family chlorophyll transporter-like MFS transporter|uniref:BCD family MFS transporter n=1 Tax=Gemmatimonas sp. TaxID=1962908 RepID=UPI0025C2CAFF|nr:BCD family MFS transporter [Gemmatimonas sp.]MCA2987043.1 BCD family MFS transporter [Gemmatimonas sp.]MCA2994835.1 BCD family MFS transporter [Gemmatimonas sp.]MCE2955195.1 BCD family MFS transporter [Gemmatimonas sp.]